MEDGLKAGFLSKIPLFSKNFEGDIFVGRACLELDDAVIWTFSGFEIVLRSFLLIVKVRIEDIKLVSLDGFGRRVIVVVVHGIILIPFDGHSLPVDVLWFEAAEASFGLAWHPVVELLLILLHSLVLLELNDLLCDEIIGLS